MPTKILAVDDSKTIRLAIKITFAAEDAEVVAINKGSEALARAKQMRPDVILVDHTLSEGDVSGVALCQQLRADPETRAIPLVFMVPARGGVTEAVSASAGADAVIGKPFDTQELLDRVGEVVKRGAGARPAAASAAPSANVSARSPAVSAVPSAATRQPASAAAPSAAAAPPAAVQRNLAPAQAPASATTPVVSAAANVATATPTLAPAAAAAVPTRDIPIVMAIPFAPAQSPTPGMLERLRKAGSGSGVSAQALEALAALSSEVVEKIAWEVIPELAEAILRERAQERTN